MVKTFIADIHCVKLGCNDIYLLVYFILTLHRDTVAACLAWFRTNQILPLFP